MMFESKMICAIKSGGKILREFKDTVRINFGSEYQIYIRNLNSEKAVVNITIDGKSITKDGIVVMPNSDMTLERFVGDDLTKGNALKFIERTGNIEKTRGIGAEDGIIRVSFKFALPTPSPTVIYHDSVWNSPYRHYINSVTCSTASITAYSVTTQGILMGAAATEPKNDVGITVPGSVSEQSFVEVASFPMESTEHVMVLRLVGEVEGEKVKQPITVKAKPKCQTCNRVNKATAKFCAECGTSLVLIA